jgi:lipoate-protein ligase B
MIIRKLGLQEYSKVRDYQKILQKKLIEGTIEETLLVCEHPAVITLGTSASEENILASKKELDEKRIDIFKTERGGDVTCHMPGQIVLYPILDLHLYKTDVAWYMRNLEEVIISTLKIYDITGERICGKTGVWVNEAKIASIGVRISRWRTMHGLSLNVKGCTGLFKLINPCGYKGIEMTEMQDLVKINLDTEEVTNNLIGNFIKVFKIKNIIEDNSFEESRH